jgi:hypothetical protein
MVHPDLQLVDILSAHPISQFLDRFRRPSAIFFKHIEQRARSCQLPSNGTAAGTVSCVVQHGIPQNLIMMSRLARSFRAGDIEIRRSGLNCALTPADEVMTTRKDFRINLNGQWSNIAPRW